MNEQDRSELAKILTMLAEIFSKKLKPTTFAMYFAALSDLTIEQINIAANGWARTGKFFPVPADLRKLAVEQSQLTAGDAWDMVMKRLWKWGYDPNFYPRGELPPPFPSAVARAVRAVGGMREIGMTENGLDIMRAHFFKCFRENQEQEEKQQLLGEPTREEAKQILSNLTKKIPALAKVGN